MEELTRVVQLVSFIAASQILLRAGLEVGLVPAGSAEAEAWHGQHFFKLWCLAGRAVDQRRSADLLNGFQLMTTGSTLIIVHRHGDCLGNQITRARAWGCAAKREIISGKSSLCSRKTAQTGLDPHARRCSRASRQPRPDAAAARQESFFKLCTTHTTLTSPLKFFTPPCRRCTSLST